MVARTTVVMYDEVLYGEGHLVGRWASGIARELAVNTRAASPVSARLNKTASTMARAGGGPTGNMKARINASSQRTGPKQVEITLTSGAFYTLYVIRGTGYYLSRDSLGRFISFEDVKEEHSGMYLPGNPGFGGGGWYQRRRGQSGNDFMSRGVHMTRTNHSSLAGYRAGAIR